jgi:parvulin-like peptidyl-prolyl isomerase
LLLLCLLFAGCGSSSGVKVSTDNVAQVGSQPVTITDYQAALAQAQASAKAQGQSLPATGSAGYAAFRASVIDELVRQAELTAEAQKLGVSVAPAEIDKQLNALKKKTFGGSEKAYEAALKQQNVTDADIRQYIEQTLLDQKIFSAVTKGTTVSPVTIAAYYAANQSQYQQAASRPVEEILVGKNKQTLANQIYSQLRRGASFAALARRYSQDPGSKDKGGKFTATQGSDVPEFDTAVFAPTAKTGVLLKPVNTSQYGWFVIEPLAGATPAKVTPESKAAPIIRKQLLQTKQQQVATAWMTKIEKSYCSGGKIAYGSGYTPSPDPCTTLKSPAPTTT